MVDERLYKSNLACFKEHFPDMAHLIAKPTPNQTTLVIEDGKPTDLELGSGRLYKMPAEEFARQQLETYFANPERIILNYPEGAYHKSPYSLRTAEFLMSTLKKHKIEALMGQPKDVIGYLFVFGVGLGLHLDELIKRTAPRHVVLIEPILEFIKHSLYTIDWGALHAWCAERDISINFTSIELPEGILIQSFDVVKEHGSYLLDGSYIYTHYPSWATNEAKNKLKEEAPYQLVAMGFFEDERDMIVNCSANLFSNPFNLIEGAPRAKRKEPAFIIASGPSLDDCIEAIKTWQDHAIIFSSGSSLQVLLSHGIIPDYHVELENIPEVPVMLNYILDLHKEMFPNGRFEGIKLVASSTVDPKVPPLFEESYLFFRDTVSSSYGFGHEHRHLYFIGPNVSNTSLAVASVLGFDEVYLFGTDCGMRDLKRHHSKNTPYFTSKTYKTPAPIDVTPTMTYPGNFGGAIITDLILNWNRMLLEQVIRMYSLRAFNCSDGVLIAGAKPKVASSVRLSSPPLNKEAVHDHIRQNSVGYKAGEFFADHDLERYLSNSTNLLEDYKNMFEESRREDTTFESFHKRLTSLMKKALDDYPGETRVIWGSAVTLPIMAVFFLNRIEDIELRETIFNEFLDHYEFVMEQMLKETRGLFEAVATRKRNNLEDAAALA